LLKCIDIRCVMADSADSQSAVTPSVGQEQAFLESYFLCLSKFAYDKAKEITVRRIEIGKDRFLGSLSFCLLLQTHQASFACKENCLLF